MEAEILKNLSIKVSQYFLDFLESDFKRQQAPRRRIILQTDNGFKSGMKVAPYKTLQSAIWNELNKPISEELEFLFQPKSFNKQLSIALKLVIKEQVETMDQSAIDAVVNQLVNQSKSTLDIGLSSPEDWIESLHLIFMDEISTQIVRPMLSLVDDALSKSSYSQVDSIFNAEADLVKRLAKPLEEVLTEVLAKFLATRDTAELESISPERFNLEVVKKILIDYFEMFVASDAFMEFRDIESYATTVEGIQLYLYLGIIKYGTGIYPMFYVPLDCSYSEEHKGFKIKISSHVYANKRAFDYILQELGERQARQWMSPIKERITYVDSQQSILDAISPMLTKIQESFGLLEHFSFDETHVNQIGDTNVTINTALHICAFEKSDEALLNDYEEMIKQARNNEQGVVQLFEGIVNGVISSNPVSIESEIQSQWDELSVEDRVVPDTPIPLNEEQVKIINAISNPNGKFIVVEGPPGTGKSHTIVAIAADCALKNKSCLILSDKKEALEVVQQKLSKTMNEVRGDKEFPNPLLRLGTEQANFRKLTSQQVLTQIQAHAKATKASQSRVNVERDDKRAQLKESINKTIGSFGKLKIIDVAYAQSLANSLNIKHHLELSKFIEDLHEDNLSFSSDYKFLNEIIIKEQLAEIYNSGKCKDMSLLLSEFRVRAFVGERNSLFDKDVSGFCKLISKESVSQLSNLYSQFQALRMPLLGYLFRGSKVASLNTKVQDIATFTKQVNLKGDFKLIESLLTQSRALMSWIEEFGEPQVNFEHVFSYFTKSKPQDSIFKELYYFLKIIESTNNDVFIKLFTNTKNQDDFENILVDSFKYLQAIHQIKSHFSAAPSFDYVGKKTEVEKLNTSLMNSEVDTRLINFMQNSKADAKVLAQLIKEKQKFPEDKFDSVKEAFPVIVASIREFGEFMPLKNDIFDVLVIDEASQVSVAQAFPALLRAKKVVVMGDGKQFSNTKSNNASNALNERYRSDLHAYFRREVSTDAAMLQRLSYFDVKRSILEFSQMCANYSIMLVKHFRSYQELISYSSKTFYGGQLQAIKIRGIPLGDVIRFTELQDEIVSSRSTNQSEAEFILNKCIELLEEKDPPTVGIITPFTEQQTFISKLFSNHANYQEFKSKLKIKIMTFDSCQGEERNIIFYSLVATKDSDTLNYIFPVELNDAQELVEQKLKIQRLNVGFSRAQEMIWFVHSKPISDFKGSIGQALNHFKLILHSNKPTHEQTDTNSPMEKKVLDWLYASEFYQVYEDKIELLPQFPIGDYLRQLDSTYQHPSYKVDFLLTFNHEQGIVHVIIEYDGFEFHFKQGADVDAGNHERYLTDSDVERQLTLESYGYKFLRINRFNLGKDPIQTISERLFRLVDLHFKDNTNELVRNLQTQANSLIDKTSKQCPKCLQIKQHEDFYDATLKGGEGGYGRNCMVCKTVIKPVTSNYSNQKHRRRRW